MADITIRMKFNLETGKKDIYIGYESDDDALPVEHEKRHRQIVEQLLGQGILAPDEVGEVKVGRVSPQSVKDDQGSPVAPQAEKQGQS